MKILKKKKILHKLLEFEGVGLKLKPLTDKGNVQQLLEELLPCLEKAGLHYQQKTTKKINLC